MDTLTLSGETVLDPLRRITRDAAIMHGAPCIRGMRIRVSDILDQLGAGEDQKSIREEWPELEDEDFLAVYRYARLAIEHLTSGDHPGSSTPSKSPTGTT